MSRDYAAEMRAVIDAEATGTYVPAIWTSGEQQGIGASRSQGYGRYEVVRWDRQA